MLDLTDIEMRHGARTVLSVPELSISGSAFTAIIGQNGSGKSTLMSLMARQQTPTTGRIFLDGCDHGLSQRDLARRLAFLPQQFADVPGLDVRELVGLGRYAWRGALGIWKDEDRQAVEEALAATDLTGFATRMVDHLSGGERQRAWIAMLIAQQSPLLLLDEPTSALDLVHQYSVMSLLRALNRSAGRGVVVVLHDVNLAARFSDRVIALKDGRIAFDGTPAQLMSGRLLTELYGIDIRLLAHPDDAHPIAIVA
ncbi:ABC transporter ATP-binding protein [Aliihoeflea sp. 40Bstr573]|uniref:ABC transporter ATP-binding protein n=1 Tax=Aliihoeflea sp. 40Bstr573 TaxID=2696467 RepID=UPI002095D02A|nr:ABC transporter ATP-binding protein [Aliihoeflea sp. 40Bstr573]MCO6387363.1 ATP-binding cassette domain-containing protein [Aliihoeflea sp. 40Bstr573]